MTAPLAQRIFASLGDGDEHSGEALAAQHGVTRSAIWKAIGQLRELGFEILATRERGYRLAHACEALEASAIRRGIEVAAARVRLRELAVAWSLDSSNSALLARPPPPAGLVDALFVEQQSGGRGRRGRAWLAPPGGSLCFSLAAYFAQLPPGLGALPLCIGVSLLESLERVGVEGLALKWPNDLVASADSRKLAGILLEMRAEAGGPAHLVIGVGVNLRLPSSARLAIERMGTQATDLDSLGADVARRNALAAGLLEGLLLDLERFEREGGAQFISRWRSRDLLQDRRVAVHGIDGVRHGTARGVDEQGALLLEEESGRYTSLLAGEVSLRDARAT